jgi:hypothetical protein
MTRILRGWGEWLLPERALLGPMADLPSGRFQVCESKKRTFNQLAVGPKRPITRCSKHLQRFSKPDNRLRFESSRPVPMFDENAWRSHQQKPAALSCEDGAAM